MSALAPCYDSTGAEKGWSPRPGSFFFLGKWVHPVQHRRYRSSTLLAKAAALRSRAGAIWPRPLKSSEANGPAARSPKGSSAAVAPHKETMAAVASHPPPSIHSQVSGLSDIEHKLAQRVEGNAPPSPPAVPEELDDVEVRPPFPPIGWSTAPAEHSLHDHRQVVNDDRPLIVRTREFTAHFIDQPYYSVRSGQALPREGVLR